MAVRGRTDNGAVNEAPVVISRLALAVAVGLAAGALTLWSVLRLPFALTPLSNAAAPWVLVAFVVALTARWKSEAALLAIVTFVALVVGFYVAEHLRGWPVDRHQVVFWTQTSVIAGPVVGLAAGWLRHAGRTAGALGAGVLGGLLTGEAVHGLTALKFSSPAHFWEAQFVLGVALAVGLTLWRTRWSSIPAVAVSLAACCAVTVGTVIAFGLQ